MRTRALTTVAVLGTAAALALSGCSSSGGGGGTKSGSSSNNAGGLNGGSTGGSGATQTYKIGFLGALSGSSAQLGINEKNGAQLAIDQANASGKYKFKLQFDPQDSEGDPAKAPAAATQLISDNVIAVLGPAFSGESEAVDPTFCKASPPVPIVTASASKATLQDQGYSCWFRIIPNDNVEGSQGADWLARTGAKKVFVLDDKTPYGAGVADTVAKELKSKGVTVVRSSADQTTTKNYKPIAQQIVSSGADALFYGGYDAYTAQLALALQAQGFTGREVTGNGSKDSTFTTNAKSAGNGWYFTCGCQDATTAPSAKTFAADYQKAFNKAPDTYSPEAYDATNVIIAAIAKASASGTATRTSVLTALKSTDYKGITTTIAFQKDGDLSSSGQIVNLFQQKNGKIVGLGNINTINK